jgi:hypothetical protein
MNRRELLRLLAMGVIGHTLDVDKLLWIPGQKKIFLPSPGVNVSEILATEWERVIPKVKELFEREDHFYRLIIARDE